MPVTPKKDSILQTGRDLFLCHGIRKVRVEEVCADAHVSKRTFYKYFRDKDALAVAVLGQLFDENRTRAETVLALDCPIEEKVARLIALKADLASGTSAAFYRDALDADTEPGRFVLREQEKWDLRLRCFYIAAQAQGQIRADLDIDVLMVLIARTRSLATDPELVGLVPDMSRLAVIVMSVFFHGIVPRSGMRSTTRRRKPWR